MLKYFLMLNLLLASSLAYCSQKPTYGTQRSSINISTIVPVPKQSYKRKQVFTQEAPAKKPKIKQPVIDLTEFKEKYSFADDVKLPVETRKNDQKQPKFTLSESLRSEQIDEIKKQQEIHGNNPQDYGAYLEGNTLIAELTTPKRSKHLPGHLVPVYGDFFIYGTPMPRKGRR